MNQQLERHADTISSINARAIEALEGIAAKLLDHEAASNLEGSLAQSLKFLCIHLAGADGPINQGEARILNILFEETQTRWFYDSLRESMSADRSLVEAANSNLEFHMRLSMTSYLQEGQLYTSEDDVVISMLSHAMDVLNAADDDVSPLELRATAATISELREVARELEAECNDALQTDSIPSNQSEDDYGETSAKASSPDPHSALHNLVGLADVKVEVETLSNLARVFALRKEKGLSIPDMSFHLVFTGNPGTGKTTVARIIAQIYGNLGLLSRGHLIEVDRSGLVANYVGQTATKTRAVIDSAKGGVLFIDEAYALSSGGENDFGREAIEVILKCMEDYRDDLVIIAAGYTDEMAQFLGSNPGLRSRFGKTIRFPDYNSDEMTEIFKRMAAGSEYNIHPDAIEHLNGVMQRRLEHRDDTFANARDARVIFEAAVSAQASRIANLATFSDDELSELIAADLPAS